jgi:hypothetical protein
MFTQKINIFIQNFSLDNKKRTLERRRQKCENNIKLDAKKLDFVDLDWIQLTQDWILWLVILNMAMKLDLRKGKWLIKKLFNSQYELCSADLGERVNVVEMLV